MMTSNDTGEADHSGEAAETSDPKRSAEDSNSIQETKVEQLTAHVSESDNLEYEYEIHRRHQDLDDRTALRRASHLRASRHSMIVQGTPFDVSFHPGRLVFYCRPRQRQNWGDTQVLPRVNWGDLFFDLYYVAAAYNVSFNYFDLATQLVISFFLNPSNLAKQTSNILVDSPSGQGFLYFLGTFVPLMSMWLDKSFYDAKFVVGDDIFHRLFELVFLVVLATAVLHIRTVDIMSNGAGEVSMFAFCLVILIANILNLARTGELYCFGSGSVVNGRKLMQEECKRVSMMNLPYVMFILSATVVAGLEYYGNNSSGSIQKEYPVQSAGNYSHRVLAGANSSSSAATQEHTSSDLPVWLLLAGYVLRTVIMAVSVIFLAPTGGKHKEV